MNLAERIASLRRTDLFTAFTDTELQSFAAKVAEVDIAAGEKLFHEGEPGDEMYVLVAGGLRIFKENRVITAVKPGDYVGEMAIIDAKPRSATVEAMTASRLLRITAEQFQEYLGHQPRSLVAMMTTLSQRIRRDTEIIAADFERANILIHDMKNALAILLYLDLMARECEPDGKTALCIKRMQEARNNLVQMMDEALRSAKHQWRGQPPRQDSLAELITEVVENECRLHPAIRDKTVTMSLDQGVPAFPFVRLEIRRVLTNLIVNAGQASAAGTDIAVALRRVDNSAEVTVRDQGAGIPAELRERIFLPHFTTKPEGNGLGLASCKQIIEERHHGSLTVDCDAQGTTFRFSLPLEGNGEPK